MGCTSSNLMGRALGGGGIGGGALRLAALARLHVRVWAYSCVCVCVGQDAHKMPRSPRAITSLEQFRVSVATRPSPKLVLLVDLFATGNDFCAEASEVASDLDIPVLCFCNGPGMPLDADLGSMCVWDVVWIAKSYHEIALRNAAVAATVYIAVRFPTSLDASVTKKVSDELAAMGAPLVR